MAKDYNSRGNNSSLPGDLFIVAQVDEALFPLIPVSATELVVGKSHFLNTKDCARKWLFLIVYERRASRLLGTRPSG